MTNSIDSLSFEQALEELETIVRGLEEGKTTLEEGIKSYERGTLLKQHCEKKLQEVSNRVRKITLTAGGSVATEPLTQEAL